jgi:hypothetical protein
LAIASIISLQFIGSPACPSTVAAASRALTFFDLPFALVSLAVFVVFFFAVMVVLPLGCV